MPDVFIDTAYLIALLRERDRLNSAAVALSHRLRGERIPTVTTTMVFAETLAAVADGGGTCRVLPAVVQFQDPLHGVQP